MKIIKEDASTYVLRFDRGEEVMGGLLSFCEGKKIQSGGFSGIGAVEAVKLSFYNVDEKKYYDDRRTGLFEIVSLEGNITIKDSKVYIHAHGSFSDKEYKVFGGHMKEMVVGATCEIVLHQFTGEIQRIFSDEVGLYLMQ